MSAPTHPVAAALIAVVSAGSVLMGRRDCGSVIHGKWEFPGGKVEHGEHPRETAVRELHEELGARAATADLSTLPVILSNEWSDGLHVVISCFAVDSARTVGRGFLPTRGIHSTIGWFDLDSVLEMERRDQALPGSYDVALAAVAWDRRW